MEESIDEGICGFWTLEFTDELSISMPLGDIKNAVTWNEVFVSKTNFPEQKEIWYPWLTYLCVCPHRVEELGYQCYHHAYLKS